MRRRRPPFVGDEKGQTIVEFALASSLFFLTVFCTLEFGVAVWQYNMMSNLAQEGARRASVQGSTSHVAPDVETFVQGRSVGINVTVTISRLPNGSSVSPSALNPGEPVSVKVQTSFAPLTALFPHATMQIKSTATMIMAR